MNFPKQVLFLFFYVSFCIEGFSIAKTDTLENSLFWKVSGNGLHEPSYLFGTYHLLNDGFLKEIKGLKKSFKKSKAVVGELEITPSVAGELMQYMVLEKGTLDSLLSPEQYDSLKIAFNEKMGTGLTMFNKMKPMAIYTMLAAADLKKLGVGDKTKGQPMDLFFQQEGKKQGKSVYSLETIKEQADILFNNTTPDRQKDMLMEYLRKGSSGKDDNAKLTDCYKKQRLNCLSAFMDESTYSETESNQMLNDRNIRWIPKLDNLMMQQSCFVAVGALHLTGEAGLIKLLREKGYTVEPLGIKK
jgi:uncharacterized protein YbaP (TraB family)